MASNEFEFLCIFTLLMCSVPGFANSYGKATPNAVDNNPTATTTLSITDVCDSSSPDCSLFLVSVFVAVSQRTNRQQFANVLHFIRRLSATKCWPNKRDSHNYMAIHFINKPELQCKMDGGLCVDKALEDIRYEDAVENVSPIGREDLALFVKFSSYFLRLNDNFDDDPEFPYHKVNLNAMIITDFVATTIAAADQTITFMLRKYNVTLDIVTIMNGRLLQRDVENYYKKLVAPNRIHCTQFYHELWKQVVNVSPCKDYNQSSVQTTTTPLGPTTTDLASTCKKDCLFLEIVVVLIFSQKLTAYNYSLLRAYIIENVRCMFVQADVAQIKILAPYNFDYPWIQTNVDFNGFLLSLDLNDLKVNASEIDDNDTWTHLLMFKGRNDLKIRELGSSQPWLLLITDFGSRRFASLLADPNILAYYSSVRFHIIIDNYALSAYSDATDNLGAIVKVSNTYYDIPDWITCDDERDRSAATREIIEITVGCLGGSFCFIALTTSIYCYLRRKQSWKEQFTMFRFKHESDGDRGVNSSGIDDEWEIERNNLYINFDEKIGSGAYGVVYKGRLNEEHLMDNKYATANTFQRVRRISVRTLKSQQRQRSEVAVKTLMKHTAAQHEAAFRREIDVIKRLKGHAHLVDMFGCVTRSQPLCLVMEWCQNGDLLTFLRARREHFVSGHEQPKRLGTKDLLSLAWQISDGMTYISAKTFIHRDLAARNILIDDNWNAKIGDFGLCVNMGRTVERDLCRLPVKWLAIECLKGGRFSTKSDVWSFGVVLYEIFSLGSVPYQNVDIDKTLTHLQAANRLERPEYASSEIYEIMSSCWFFDPEMRPNFTTLQSAIATILLQTTENYGYVEVTKETV